ncbi:MAG: hypothetical protein WA892_00480 [Ornithinimicrobium sp.]
MEHESDHGTENVASADQIEELIDSLSEEPPYAAIGKVIHAGADLESGMFALCTCYGLPHEKTWRKDVAERVKWLKANSPVPADVLDRVEQAVIQRNLLAHGTWIRVKGERGFVKHEKADPDHLHGQIVDATILEEWRSELQDLADAITSHHLIVRGAPASDKES